MMPGKSTWAPGAGGHLGPPDRVLGREFDERAGESLTKIRKYEKSPAGPSNY